MKDKVNKLSDSRPNADKARKVKLLMLATSRLTRGGITSVLKAYEQCPFWRMYQVRWIETHIDHGNISKCIYLLKALLQFVFVVRQYNIIHIHVGEKVSVKRKYIFFKIAKRFKKRIVIHLHVGDQLFSDKMLRQDLQTMLEEADAVVVLSSNIQKEIEKKISIKQIYTVSNPCPIVSNVVYTDEKKYILYMGALNHNKGYDVLISAFALIASKFPGWKLVFAGFGETERAFQLAQKYGIEERVVFHGWVSGREKDNLLRYASVFCLCSYAEGFPISVLESWAYGLPLITTPVGGLLDVLRHGQNALLFSPGNKEELANKLAELLSDSKLRKRLSQASLQLAHGRNLKDINKALVSLYHQVLC